jgi:hypothetical protein
VRLLRRIPNEYRWSIAVLTIVLLGAPLTVVNPIAILPFSVLWIVGVTLLLVRGWIEGTRDDYPP